MMVYALAEGKRVSVGFFDGQTCPATTALFVGHANGSVVGWPGIAIAGVKQIEAFASVIKPTVSVEIATAILANRVLKFPLKRGDVFVKRLGRGCKIIGAFYTHFVEISV